MTIILLLVMTPPSGSNQPGDCGCTFVSNYIVISYGHSLLPRTNAYMLKCSICVLQQEEETAEKWGQKEKSAKSESKKKLPKSDSSDSWDPKEHSCHPTDLQVTTTFSLPQKGRNKVSIFIFYQGKTWGQQALYLPGNGAGWPQTSWVSVVFTIINIAIMMTKFVLTCSKLNQMGKS